jgi:hypothetical protein
MKVEVRLTKVDLIKVVEVDEDEFKDDLIPHSSSKGVNERNIEIRKFLLEQLEDEYTQVETNCWVDARCINKKEEMYKISIKPDMKVSKKNGSYFIEK